MAYVTIEKNGLPWMLCHSTHEGEVERQAEAARADDPAAHFSLRDSTAEESQRCAEAMDAQEGLVENPFEFFSVRLHDYVG